MTDFEQTVFDLYTKNRREKDGHIYTMPSPQSYPYQWLWDSCFHAIVLRHFDIEWAKQELLSLVSRQFDDGMIPHMIYWTPSDKLLIHWGTRGTSSITQPPILADAVAAILELDDDHDFLQKIYPSLKKFYDYFLEYRDIRHHYLVGIINPDESGEDNSPRFDAALNLPPVQTEQENFQRRLQLIKDNVACNFAIRDCMENFFWVKDLPFNVYLIHNLRSMATLAEKMQNAEHHQVFLAQADSVANAMREYMWHDGRYWTIYGEQYQKAKVKTWALFAPLYAKLYSPDEAKAVIHDHLLNENEFWLPYPIPTVAKDEPSFDATGYWRGPTWAAPNWFVFQGLLAYGYSDLAKQLFEKTNGLIDQSGFREHFNPLTGEGQGATNFTWGGLVVDMERTLATH